MIPKDHLKEIEIRFGYGTTFDMSLREKDGHWLIQQIKKLIEIVDKHKANLRREDLKFFLELIK